MPIKWPSWTRSPHILVSASGIAKYGKGQLTDDIAEAVAHLFEKNILPNMGPASMVVPNSFRIERLYSQEVDALLRKHQVLEHKFVIRKFLLYLITCIANDYSVSARSSKNLCLKLLAILCAS